MRIIEEMYGEIFAGWRGQLKALVKADPWEAHHTETFKTIISDYHNTMRDIKNLSQVRQVTDEDGSLYTLWQFPVWTAYKKIYQTVMLNIQDGNVLSLALVTL
ncbi:MAG: hypothetical protein CO079_09430 [Nitrosopumilales archaeon CG_4_9_14_0_8_um_filter_34_10]|nr:MAG: hypothetical protein CO079_09430 [Nitrosopumilales archaeon CG_4_9_14_0_8_um_filter_34_10]